MQGHVDGTGTVAGIRAEGISRVLEIEVEPALRRYVVEKGSIALDGVSLTVSALERARLRRLADPRDAAARRRLGAAEVGGRVNVEVDVLAKHVERLLGSRLQEQAPVTEGVP